MATSRKQSFTPVTLKHARNGDVVQATSPSELVNLRGAGYVVEKAPEPAAKPKASTTQS